MMTAWIARDKIDIRVRNPDNLMYILFFNKKPELKEGALWQGEHIGGRWPVPAKAFPKLEPGEIRRIRFSVDSRHN